MFTEDWGAFFAPGLPGVITVQLGGQPRQAQLDRGPQVVGGAIVEADVSVVMPGIWASAAAPDGQIQLPDGLYRIRQILPEPPDGALVRLILAKE